MKVAKNTPTVILRIGAIIVKFNLLCNNPVKLRIRLDACASFVGYFLC